MAATIEPSPEPTEDAAVPEPTPTPIVAAVAPHEDRSTVPAPTARLTAPVPAPTAEPAPAPMAAKPQGLEAVVVDTVATVALVVKPAAAVAVASTFGFPLILMAAVLLFLMIQGRLDHRDARLRAALGQTAEAVVPFEDEERL